MTLEEMWARLARHQPFADRRGYGPEWAKMCEQRTEEAAWAAKSASEADEAASVSASAAAWALMLVSEEAKAEAAAEADEAVRWIERSEVQE